MENLDIKNNQRVALARKEFHEQRMLGIGGSDIAVIMGITKYRSELQLFLEKTGQADPFEGNRFTKWGSLLEPVIIESYRQLQGLAFHDIIFNQSGENKPELFLKDADGPFISHLDGIVWPDEDKEYILKVKTFTKYHPSAFGQEGSDDIPKEYATECQWDMAIAGSNVCHLLIILGENDDRCYTVYRNNNLIRDMKEKAVEWWDRHIIKKVAPGDPIPVYHFADIFYELLKDHDDLFLLHREHYIPEGAIQVVTYKPDDQIYSIKVERVKSIEVKPETRQEFCPSCCGKTDQNFVEIEGGENGSDWHCSQCKQAVV